MSQHTEKLAVMFADICDSTGLYERLGDKAARRLVEQCLAMMIDKMKSNQGILIETKGDEIMCVFQSPENAMNAACAMQNAMENYNHGEKLPMHIRIGFHYGDVVCEEDKLFGDTINVASRVASITRADQIITTPAAVNSLPPGMRMRTHKIMRTDIKGKQNQFDIFRVIWETDEAALTHVRVDMTAYSKLPEKVVEMTLRYRDKSCQINEHHKSAMLGRDESCDIEVNHGFTSRRHVRIELRSDQFVIADQSTNGTFIRFSDGHSVRLGREELVLHGCGSINLGQSYEDNPLDIVGFFITTVSA